jgi:hypothetical protein
MTRPEWPVAAIWAALAGASLAGFLLAEGLAPPRVAATVAIALVGFKVNLVFGQYMDLPWSQQPLRGLFTAWLAGVCLILLAGYWSAP